MNLTLRQRFSLKRFFIGENPSNEPVTLSHRRIFILPTPAGSVCGLLLCVMLLASVVYNNNLGFILTFLLGSVCLVSILHNFRSMAGLSVQAGKSTVVFAGEFADLTVLIANPTPLRRINLHVSANGSSGVILCVPPRTTISAPLRIKTIRRGWHTVGTVTLASYFPLGLFRAWSPVNMAKRILVYPTPAARTNVPPSRLSTTQHAATPDREADDFFGLHAYQPGDSIRQIHWKAFAKGLGLQSKHYGRTICSDLWFDLEQTPGNTLESKIGLLCRWILDAHQTGSRFGLRLPNSVVNQDRGDAHRSKCLKLLALL